MLYFADYFRMSETLECYILLQLLISILSLLSGLCQIVVLRIPSLQRISKISVLTFSIISSAITLISFRLSDHYGVQYIIILSLSLFNGSLQVVMLGLVTHRKVTVKYSVHEHIV